MPAEPEGGSKTSVTIVRQALYMPALVASRFNPDLKAKYDQLRPPEKRRSAAYLADVLDRIHDHKINRLDELLPWNWSPLVRISAEAT
jgi:hypothetical protein